MAHRVSRLLPLLALALLLTLTPCAVLLPVSASAAKPLCYTDPANATSLLPGLATLGLPSPFRSQDMTPQVCLEHCVQLSFAFYALLQADACACGDQQPLASNLLSASDATANISPSPSAAVNNTASSDNQGRCIAVPCAGDAELFCGASDITIALVFPSGFMLDAETRRRLHNSNSSTDSPHTPSSLSPSSPPFSPPLSSSVSEARNTLPTPSNLSHDLIATDTFSPESVHLQNTSHATTAAPANTDTSEVPTSAITGGLIGAGITLSVGAAVLSLLFVRRRRRQRQEAEEREEERGMVRASHYNFFLQSQQASGSPTTEDGQNLSRNISGNSGSSVADSGFLKAAGFVGRKPTWSPEAVMSSGALPMLRPPSIAITTTPPVNSQPSNQMIGVHYLPVLGKNGPDSPSRFLRPDNAVNTTPNQWRASWVDPRYSIDYDDTSVNFDPAAHPGMVLGSMESLQDAVDYAPRLHVRNRTSWEDLMSNRSNSFG